MEVLDKNRLNQDLVVFVNYSKVGGRLDQKKMMTTGTTTKTEMTTMTTMTTKSIRETRSEAAVNLENAQKDTI